MIRVGVTGGIGSGKSRVCTLFAERGISVYDSDARAREIVNGGGTVKKAIVELFGPGAYKGNILDKNFIADRVFKDKMLLASLNGVVHPVVALDFDAWTMSRADEPYVVLESAILFESGFDRFVDKVVTVSAPEELRIARTASRDGVSRQSVMERIANQLTDDAREARADYVINNGGSLRDLAAEVDKLDKILRQ